MDLVKTYGDIIKKNIRKGKTDRARKEIILGLKLESFRVKKLDKVIPDASRMLSLLALKSTYEGLEHPEKCALVNIFAPVEIVHQFGYNCVSMECVSCMISGFKNADIFIDEAESAGIAQTLCSYHKNFIGSVLTDVMGKPAFAVTTSMACDGNINTFRFLKNKKGIESVMIDVPEEETEENLDYVVDQLKQLIAELEKTSGKKFSMEELKRTLDMENESRACYLEYLKLLKEHQYPTTLTLMLYTLFASHLHIGREDILEYYRALKEDVKKYPKGEGKRFMWVHMIPYYQETLKSYFNFNDDYYLTCFDFNLDFVEQLDTSDPLRALAHKMITNIYNKSYQEKAGIIRDTAREMEADGVIHFCHWGCKQDSGGSMLLKKELDEAGVPLLTLDGDALDRRNSHDGQIKTRLEAFLELVDKKVTK